MLPDLPKQDTKKDGISPKSLNSSKPLVKSGSNKEKVVTKRRSGPSMFGKVGFQMVRHTSTLLFIVVVLAMGAFYVDLHNKNKYLSIIGRDNTFKIHQAKSKENEGLNRDLDSIKSRVARLEKKIENKDYYEHKTKTDKIKSEMLEWVDRVEKVESEFSDLASTDTDDGVETANSEDEPEEVVIYGIIDTINRVEGYFNSDSYRHQILSGNLVNVDKVSVTRKKISFTTSLSNLFGKTFYLGTEFIEMINSLPFYKNASVTSFTRKISKEGDEEMQMSLNVGIQLEGEKDPADKSIEQLREELDYDKAQIEEAEVQIEALSFFHQSLRIEAIQQGTSKAREVRRRRIAPSK